MTPDPGHGVHPAAAVGFDREAATYATVRPSYPPAVIDRLRAEGVGPGARVCDLAAGTGILTGPLVDAGFDVVAVEPVAGMAAELAARLPDVELLDGVAEALPLRDGAIGAVTVAQAFHWFDARSALAEIRRVLRAGGVLLLAWNVRDESVDWVRRITDLVERRTGGRPYSDHRDRPWSDVVGAAGGFTQLLHERVPNPVATTPGGVVARVRSTSFVAALDRRPRQRLLDEVAELLATHPDTAGREALTFPHDTVIHWCHRR